MSAIAKDDPLVNEWRDLCRERRVPEDEVRDTEVGLEKLAPSERDTLLRRAISTLRGRAS